MPTTTKRPQPKESPMTHSKRTPVPRGPISTPRVAEPVNRSGRSALRLTASTKGAVRPQASNPFRATDEELDWDDATSPTSPPPSARPRKPHKSIVPPRPHQPFTATGAPRTRQSVPPFAAAANLATPPAAEINDDAPAEFVERQDTIRPAPQSAEEATTLDVLKLIRHAMHDTQPAPAERPATKLPTASDSLSPSACAPPLIVRQPKSPIAFAAGILASCALVGAALGMVAFGLHTRKANQPMHCAAVLPSLAAPASAVLQRQTFESKKPAVQAPRLPLGRACTLSGSPRQLLSSASPNVPMEASVDASANRAALGLAASNGRPVGFSLRLDNLRTERSTMGWAPTPLRRVVPLLHEGDLSVATDLDDASGPDGLSHAVKGPESIRVGTYRRHLTLTKGTELPEVLWELPGSVDAVDASTHQDEGAAIALRCGATVYLGRANTTQRPVGPLTRVSGARIATGAVRVAWRGSEVVVAYEVQSDEGPSVALIGTQRDEADSLAWAPTCPKGSEIHEPAVSTLSDGRWLVTWTERSPSSSRIRMQTLDALLRPVGETTDVTPDGEQASGGVLATVLDAGAVFYFKRGSSQREAWATSVTCP